MVDVPLRFDDLRTYGGGGAQTVSLQGKLREVVETIKYKQDNEMVNVGNLDNIQKISIMSIQCSDSDMKRVEDFLIFICAAVFGVAVGAVIELLVALTKSAFPAAPVPTDFPSGDRFVALVDFLDLIRIGAPLGKGVRSVPQKLSLFVNRRLSGVSLRTCCFRKV